MHKALIRPEQQLRETVSRLGASPYMAAVFLSAALVFLVQPMFAKMATPLLGGSPNVWNVSLVCFQAALLLGYTYAHLLTHFVTSLRTQILIHMMLLACAAIVLPFQLSGLLGEPDPTRPALWLIGVFTVSIAPPFAIIAASAPLIQSWYSRSGRTDAHDPYHLYGASNVGSLIGLIAYPLVLEPFLPLAAQTMSWTLGYGVLALLLIGSGLVAMVSGDGQAPASDPSGAPVFTEAASIASVWRQRLWWVACAFIPSSLLVGVTTHISTDIASAPFLWVLPLVLYIGSFIIVFAKKPVISPAVSARLLPLAVATGLFMVSPLSVYPLLLAMGLNLFVLFMTALAGHGMLAASRPEAKRLTEFYLLMSLGGVLGGAFNALLAPIIFNSVIEYPLMLVAILLLRPGVDWLGKERSRLWGGAALSALLVAYALRLTFGNDSGHNYPFILLHALAVLGVIVAARTRATPILAAGCAVLISQFIAPVAGAITDRSFFGVVKIRDNGELRLMSHGTTLHGSQFLSADKALSPTTYYAPTTPIGQIFTAAPAQAQLGVVGLGTGSVACYAKPEQNFTYYEIDPLVVKYASDPDYFTYLSACTPQAEIVLGDGRLSLSTVSEGHFDVLLIDAFSSDSIPAHLLTSEAVELYISRLSEQGVLVLHVSNRHMNLSEIVARIARHIDLPAYYQFYQASAEDKKNSGAASSQVVILAHSEAALQDTLASGLWTRLDRDSGRPWTDDYSNILGAILAAH